jgi:hypothetical protein
MFFNFKCIVNRGIIAIKFRNISYNSLPSVQQIYQIYHFVVLGPVVMVER